MSALPCSDELDAKELPIQNYAAFADDHVESRDTTWSSLRTDLVNLSQSLRSDDFSKENRSPNGEDWNSQVKIVDSVSPLSNDICKESSGRDIDAEIDEIEKEISRLKSRLDALRLEKVEREAKTTNQPRGIGESNMDLEKKMEGTAKMIRRGVSLGPMEIASNFKFRPLSKAEITPVISVQNIRKSCFWKLQEIDELKVTKDRRKSLSNSPKSRKTAAKNQPQRQALTTVGSRKGVKKEEGVILSIQPKKLFDEGESSVPSKKPVKQGRVIASRYSQISMCAARKSKEEDNKKSSLESSLKTPLTIGRVTDVLPKIRTVRCLEDSSRDSGCAKRVSELVGRRGYFDEKGGEPFTIEINGF